MFKSWLVSNIGFAFIVIYAIVALIYMIIPGDMENLGKFLLIFGPALVVLIFAGGIADAGLLGSIIVGLFGLALIVGSLYLVWGGIFGDMGSEVAISGGVLAAYNIISFIVSVIVGVYAFYNYDDIVDTRWMYRHSEVSIYEEEWKYALNRFGVTLAGFSGFLASLFVVILIK